MVVFYVSGLLPLETGDSKQYQTIGAGAEQRLELLKKLLLLRRIPDELKFYFGGNSQYHNR